jgi:hypothetical protein
MSTFTTRLTAISLAATTLATTALSAAEARGFASVAPHQAAIVRVAPQVMRISPIPVTTTSPAPAPVRKPPLGDLGGSRGMTGAGGGNAGGTEGVKCQGDRDCGIFRN